MLLYLSLSLIGLRITSLGGESDGEVSPVLVLGSSVFLVVLPGLLGLESSSTSAKSKSPAAAFAASAAAASASAIAASSTSFKALSSSSSLSTYHT